MVSSRVQGSPYTFNLQKIRFLLHPPRVNPIGLVWPSGSNTFIINSFGLFCYACARNGTVYTGIPYRNFFLPEFHASTYQYIMYPFNFSIFPTVYPSFAFKKYTGTSKFQI
jgi:hypothetical protein